MWNTYDKKWEKVGESGRLEYIFVLKKKLNSVYATLHRRI